MVDFLIRDGILLKCKSDVTQALLSNNVKEVAADAFISRTKLQTIKFADGLVKINKRAFYNCYMLREVILPDSVTFIDNSAFANCVCLDDSSRKRINKINPLALI